MVRFDAYSATTQAATQYELMACLRRGGDVVKVRQGKGFHTFSDRISVSDDTGTEWGSLMWGGPQGDRVMLEVKGERTPAVVEALRADFPHRCTRVDACADFDAPGAFEGLLAACMKVKKAHRIIGGKAGDWDDFPERGRTLYLGGKSSVTRTRLYEKGKQPEYLHLERPDLTRLEVQVRPAKEAKSSFSELSPIDVWGASRWTRELAAVALREHVDPHPAGTIWKKTDLERRMDFMCKQYGPTLLELFASVGSWECVGLSIAEKLKEKRR